jgi:hypothetical protein
MKRARIGRGLVTFVALFWALGAIAADFNETHVFNTQWLPHARFHAAFQLVCAACTCVIAIRLTWSRDLRRGALLAAIYPAAFFVTPLVPGVSFSDPGRPAPAIAGLPGQLVLAVVTVSLLVLGYVLASGTERLDRERTGLPRDRPT